MVECPRPDRVRAINGLVQVVHRVLRFARVSLHDPRDRLVVRPDDHEVLQRELGESGCVALNAATARQSEPGSKLSQNFGLDSIQAAQPEPGLRSSAIVVSLANLRQ